MPGFRRSGAAHLPVRELCRRARPVRAPERRALWRASLAELLAVLGLEGGQDAPRGAYGAIPLWRGGRLRRRPGPGRRVFLASAVAGALGLGARALEQVERAALLHDVGKVATPAELLHKDGPLDAHEWKIMREHPVIGERILRRTPELTDIAPIVRHEHERWDGGGYPDGIAGSAIPVGARIILACDAYNAMITERPYRRPMSRENACAELRENAGTQFDPEIVEALLGVLAPARARYLIGFCLGSYLRLGVGTIVTR